MQSQSKSWASSIFELRQVLLLTGNCKLSVKDRGGVTRTRSEKKESARCQVILIQKGVSNTFYTHLYVVHKYDHNNTERGSEVGR